MISTATARKYRVFILVMYTHTHSRSQMMSVVVNASEVSSWTEGKKKVSHCLHFTKQNLTYTQWNGDGVRQRGEQISEIVHGGRFEDLHLMLSTAYWWYFTLKSSCEMCDWEGSLVMRHCHKLDIVHLFTARGSTEWVSCRVRSCFPVMRFSTSDAC